MRRTRIVCTIGPATSSPKPLERLIETGMDVARLNFSHGTREGHGRTIRNLRETSGRLGRPVAILQDLAGPKIRIGPIKNGPITLVSGETFTLSGREVPGDVHRVSLTYKDLPAEVLPGDRLLLSDGELELVVEETSEEEIRCRVVVGGSLSSSKGINLPDRSIRAPSLTEKDREDLAFGLEQGVDFIALSFVRTAIEVERTRSLIAESGRDTPILAKIEKREALDHIDEIIRAADGIMIARGDLGVEIPIEDVPKFQKMLIEKANQAGKPAITATQMLRSMVENPRPTRAEVTDVANAILDGTDAVMLSEETAVGRYPVKAVEMMSRIAGAAESTFPFRDWAARFEGKRSVSRQEAVVHAACQLAEEVKAAAIITCTQSGSTTRLVSKYRPSQPILAMTPDETTRRRLALTWGSVPLRIEATGSHDELERESLRIAGESGYVESGQAVVLIAGYPLHQPGITNMIKISVVE